jgi:hypothetical protein
MKFAALIFSARLWLVVMIAMTMSFGASVADIHPADADEIACQTADLAAESSGDERSPHEHHVHTCGSCHVHMVGMKVSSLTNFTPVTRSLRPGSDQGCPRAGPHGLYRPPRA